MPESLRLLLPYLISFLLGFLVLDRIQRTSENRDPALFCFLAGVLGLGLSAYLAYGVLLCWGYLHKGALLALHILLIFVLLIERVVYFVKEKKPFFACPRYPVKALAPFSLVLAALIPLWIQAKFFPFGGWDAWSVWNFKAKFIFLAQDKWTNLFDPLLWRSSPHYPLLLPLINTWAWTVFGRSAPIVPMMTSMVFIFLVSGLLYFGLYRATRSWASILAPLGMMLIPFFGTIATSQYCDIVLSVFLLAGMICFLESLRDGDGRAAACAGILWGMLSFTKPEGMLAAVIATALGIGFFLTLKREHGWGPRRTCARRLVACFILSFLPMLSFQIFFNPGNQTFVNGLLSQTRPSTVTRLQVILMFLFIELKGAKWNGIWIAVILGILLAGKKGFQKDKAILPLFLFFYLCGILAYYFVNTHFEIIWWCQVTLHRILISLLPVFLYWIFSAIWQPSEK